MPLAAGFLPFVLWIIGGGCRCEDLWPSIQHVISRFHVENDMHVCYCPLFSKCLPVCDVSARFNMKEGEEKVNISNLIIEYPTFNLGRNPRPCL